MLLLGAFKPTADLENKANSLRESRRGEMLVAEAAGIISKSGGYIHFPRAFVGAITWQAVKAYIQEPTIIANELR